MSPNERDRIRKLVEKFHTTLQAYDHFYGRMAKELEDKYNKQKADIESIPLDQLEVALKPSKFDHMYYYKERLANLVNFYRIRLALQLEPDPDDLWEALQPFINKEIETFTPPNDLPYKTMTTGIKIIDEHLLQKAGVDRYPLNKATLDGAITTKIAQLILELWNYIPDEEIKAYVQKVKTSKPDYSIIGSIVLDLERATRAYMDIASKQKPKSHGVFGAIKSAFTSKPNVPEVEDLIAEIKNWQSIPPTELEFYQVDIVGRIEALTRVFNHPQQDIEKTIQGAHKNWWTKYKQSQYTNE